MGIRLEFYERYAHSDQPDQEYLESLGVRVEKKYQYRRISVYFNDIERIIEIPENETECIIRLYSGEQITVRENFDILCICINDLENALWEEDIDE